MRTQGQARFTGQDAASMVREWTAKEELDRGILPNSQTKPKYSVWVYLIVGGIVSLGMLTGVALAVIYGN